MLFLFYGDQGKKFYKGVLGKRGHLKVIQTRAASFFTGMIPLLVNWKIVLLSL